MKRHKFHHLLVTSFALVTTITSANPLPIINPSFESPAVAEGTLFIGNLADYGWNSGIIFGGPSIQNLSGFQADGTNSLTIYAGDAVTQTLTTSITPNTVYTLRLSLGNDSASTTSGTRAQWSLSAQDPIGNLTQLVSKDELLTSIVPTPNTFTEAPTLSFNSQNHPNLIGQLLHITLAASGEGTAHFDHLQLDTTSQLVTTPADSGPGSLRQAITDAPDGHTIIFDPSIFNGEPEDIIALSSPLTLFSRKLHLDATPIPQGVTLDANHQHRPIVLIGTDSELTLRRLNITRGFASGGRGGGVNDDSSNATILIENCAITNCQAGTTGGAIWNQGHLTLINTTLYDNKAGGRSGGLSCQGGTTTSIINCTIANNRTIDLNSSGGGITASSGSLSIENSLLLNNTSVAGDGSVFAVDILNQIGTALQLPAPNIIAASVGSYPSTGFPNADGHYIGTHNAPLTFDLHLLDLLYQQNTTDLGKRAVIPLPSEVIQTAGRTTANTPATDQLGHPRLGTSSPLNTSTGIGAIQTRWNENLSSEFPAGLPTIGDITQPDTPITAYPATAEALSHENLPSAIDDDPATTYRNLNRLDTGFTVTPALHSFVTGLTYTTASDLPGRDPATAVLYGQEANGNVQLIRMIDLPPSPTRGETHTLYFDTPTPAYQQYRLIFPSLTDPTEDSMQVAEVALLGAEAPDQLFQIIGIDLQPNPSGTSLYLATYTFTSQPGQSYRAQSSADLQNWQTWNSNITGTGFETSVTHETDDPKSFTRFVENL